MFNYWFLAAWTIRILRGEALIIFDLYQVGGIGAAPFIWTIFLMLQMALHELKRQDTPSKIQRTIPGVAPMRSNGIGIAHDFRVALQKQRLRRIAAGAA